MSAMLAIGGTGILFLAALNLLTFLLAEFSRWRGDRSFPRLARAGRPPYRRALAGETAPLPFPSLSVDYAVAAYYARHHLARVVPLEDGPGGESLTPDFLRSLLGSPGDGTVARFDAEGGFAQK